MPVPSKKKKPAKAVDVATIVITAIVDLIEGLILLILDRYI